MKNRKINCLVMFLILFVSLFFINIDGVKADTIEGGNGLGYSQCSYKWQVTTSVPVGDDFYDGYDHYRLTVKLWNSTSDGKHWVNWNHKLTRATFYYDVQKVLRHQGDKEHENEYVGEKYNINVFDNLTSNNYTMHSCQSFVCYKKSFGSEKYKWRFPSSYELENKKCMEGFSKADKSSGKVSNTTVSDGVIRDNSLSEQLTKKYSESLGSENVRQESDGVASGGSTGLDSTNIDFSGGEEKVSSCEMLGGENSEFLKSLRNIFTTMQVAGIVLCVILCIWDAVTSLVSGEQDRVSKLFNRIVKRLIAVAILLILPVLIGFILDILELAGVEDIGGICIDQFEK